jgi:hypothetical protein
MKKILSLVLITLGIGLTAGFGAVLSPEFRKATIVEAEAKFSDTKVERLKADYCAVLATFKLPDAEGCGDTHLVEDSGSMSKIEWRKAQLGALARNKEILVVDVSQTRILYRLAIKRSLSRWTAHAAQGTQGPGARLSGWADVGGIGFGLGLLLLVVGAWMARQMRGVPEPEETEDGLVDFGALLGQVVEAVTVLHTEMAALAAPTVGDLEGFKRRLEETQKDALARLCASGPRISARHGLEGMAMVFSPLSAGERKLNRAWAAMVDRHWPEALLSVAGAQVNLEETVRALGDLST